MRRDALALLLACLALPARAGDDLVVKAGRGFDGTRFVEGPLTIVARDGRIAEGPAPAGAPVLDASALFVMPGLVDLRSGAGLSSWDANEERGEVTPAWRAIEAVDAHSPDMARALQSGITTIVVAPGGRNVVGGLAAAIKTDDRPLQQRVVARDAAMLLTLGFEPALGNRSARFQAPWGLKFRRPGNRMGTVAELRRAIFVAREGAATDEADAMRRVLSGEIPAWFVARTDADVRTALQVAREMGVVPVLLEAFEAHRRAEEIAAAGAAAIVGPEYELPRTLMERIDGQDARASTAAILAAAGVTVALGGGMDDDPGTLRDRAGLAVRNGLPRETALRAVTSVPAELLGCSGHVGTLHAGADADLVLLDGDPLSPATRVVGVVVAGRLAWHRPPCPDPEPSR